MVMFSIVIFSSFICRKVLSKLQLDLSEGVIRGIANCKPFFVESFLLLLRRKIDYRLALQNQTLDFDKPEVDQRQERKRI